MKKIVVSLVAFIVVLSMSKVADAHVTLNPNSSKPGSYDKYDVRVPVEKEQNTTKVELKVPKGLNVVGVEPVNGFNHQFTKDKKGNITKITWEATHGGIKPNEFIDFPIQVANPNKEGKFKWDAYQTYKNGDVVKWTGNEKSETPAPVTTVSKSISSDQSDEKNDTSNSNVALWIVSIVAILLSLIAIFKKSRQS
ncbi:YcnI family protein [Staphylococcus durrellii]|uniref:YcnI family protein n=1 Tax=Staphylococcus durrellii TaxID=2781773 RepID=UPI00189DB53D|nr:YcnI family protein [Staphylococcus durrellii]MBF7016342.1 YcnI family protein [Staphylococcus durrellii]